MIISTYREDGSQLHEYRRPATGAFAGDHDKIHRLLIDGQKSNAELDLLMGPSGSVGNYLQVPKNGRLEISSE